MPCMFFGAVVIAETELVGGKRSVVCEAMGVGFAFCELVGVEIGIGLLTNTPLLHTNFFPDFMQV